jgi:predicted MPP superfamily phosphohydrolase
VGNAESGPARLTFDPLRRRPLRAPRVITGRERRWLDPNRGPLKILERRLDIVVSRFLYPHLARIWNPYSWLLQRRFSVADAEVAPAGWPQASRPLRMLLVSDVHTGIFLKPEILASIVGSLMVLGPDLVALAGDLVTGHARELDPFLEALAPLAGAPLGAWSCLGNHDYFGGDPERICTSLESIGIRTLRNESVKLTHGGSSIVVGGIDDLVMGRPDWTALVEHHGTPHLLLAHNPDHFHAAAARGVPLTLSGHTHGGQIRLPNGPPIIRQSRFCLDEGAYAFQSSLLVVSRGIGSVGLPWRWGADPEAILLDVVPPA